MLVISNENSGCDLLFLVSRNWCRNFNSMSQPDSLCLYYISVSRPRFDVTTSFLLLASLLLCRNFLFRLRHLSVVLSLQAGRDSTLLVCLFSCRDVVIKLRPSSFFNQCNSCRDLKSMSRLDCSSFLLKYMSRPQFHVATSFMFPYILIFVTTMLF